jgi:hypothetical protein
MVAEGDLDEGEIVEQYPTVEGTVVERTPVVPSETAAEEAPREGERASAD